MNRLNLINEKDEIIGEESRKKIHQDGLLHREIHVWFYTPKGGIIFQHRGKNKDTYPDLLDATVGGHVEIGETYEETAIKEVEEETGQIIEANDLVFITTTRTKTFDEVTGMTNNTRKNVYAYRFEGDINNLRIEKGKAIGFESWPLERIFNISKEDRKRFIPNVFSETTLNIFKEVEKKI